MHSRRNVLKMRRISMKYSTSPQSSMTGRVRTASVGSSEEVQVWQAVRNQLKCLDNARTATMSGYERVVRAQTESPTKNMEGIYNVVENSILDEQRYVCFSFSAISGALEQIDILSALRHASINPTSDTRRRKRKGDEPSDDVPETSNDTKLKLATDMRRSRISSTSSTKRNTETGTRQAFLQVQLPLQRGRKVAFNQPQRNDGILGDDGEVWIMATVTGCIHNDPTRYVVQDAEEEGTNGPYVICFTQYL